MYIDMWILNICMLIMLHCLRWCYTFSYFYFIQYYILLYDTSTLTLRQSRESFTRFRFSLFIFSSEQTWRTLSFSQNLRNKYLNLCFFKYLKYFSNDRRIFLFVIFHMHLRLSSFFNTNKRFERTQHSPGNYTN